METRAGGCFLEAPFTLGQKAARSRVLFTKSKRLAANHGVVLQKRLHQQVLGPEDKCEDMYKQIWGCRELELNQGLLQNWGCPQTRRPLSWLMKFQSWWRWQEEVESYFQ